MLKPDEAIELPAEPGALLVQRAAVWVTQPHGLLRVSISRRRITTRVDLGMAPFDIVAGHGSLWVVGMVQGRERVTSEGRYPVIHVARLHARTGRILARITIPARSNGNRLAATGRSVWVTDPAEGSASSIFAIDPTTYRLRELPSGEEPVALVPARDVVWSANHDDGTLRAQHAATARILRSVRLPGEPHGLAVGSGYVWVADGHRNRVLQIAPDTLAIIRRVRLGHETGPLAPASRGGVWATAPWHPADSAPLRRIDRDGRLQQTVAAGAPIIDFEARAGALWIATTGRNRLLRIRE